MSTAVRLVGYLNLVAFVGLALVAAQSWRARRGRAAFWAMLTFGSLGFVVLLGRAVPEDPRGFAEIALQRIDVAILVLFPYLLYRFTTAFDPPTRRLEGLLGAMTVILVAWTFLLPDFPQEGEARPALFVAYLVAFLFHWAALSVIAAYRLWRAGRGEPSVARARMHMLSFAAASLTVAIFVVAVPGSDNDALALAGQSLALASAVGFWLGLAPPAIVKMLWRREEQERLQAAVAELMGTTSEDEIAAQVLPPMARMVGATGVALLGSDMAVIASHGDTSGGSPLHVETPFGSLAVWTTKYAPFFGDEELKLLRALGGLTGLALDRARLFAQERDARVALEQADELKTNFVALAAHELRNPVASVHGMAQTLHELGHRISAEQRAQLEESLAQQTSRLGSLVDQLLDLSRLDADVIRIRPERLELRSRVEEIVSATAGERSDAVRVEIPEGLEAVVDIDALERVVSNLVANALRYGEAPVTVAAVQRDRHLRVTVADQGAGVPAEFVAKLFERFTRSETTREQAAGTGLGLAIARSYAKAHGGDLLYHPGTPRGARFELVLPNSHDD